MLEGTVLVLKFQKGDGMLLEGIRVFKVFSSQLCLITHTPLENEEKVQEMLGKQGIERSVSFDTDDGISGLWTQKGVPPVTDELSAPTIIEKTVVVRDGHVEYPDVQYGGILVVPMDEKGE